jgi:ubiquinone/menaquinone biosynthesis C-methylase UbiE
MFMHRLQHIHFLSHLSYTNTIHQWDADLYQQRHNFVWEYGSSLLELVDLQPGDRVLDLGCGTGELTRQLQSRAANVTAMGLDADPTMIQRATEQFGLQANSSKNLFFVVGDACDFILDKPVDVLFSNAALHWVGRQNAPRAVATMARALKDNGRFVLEFGGRGNVQTVVQAIQKVLNLPAESSDFWYFPSIGEFTSLMEQRGLEVTRAELFDRPTELSGPDGMKNWLTMFGNNFFANSSDEMSSHAIDRIVEELRPSLYDGETWRADYRRIRVVGRKRP